MVQGGGMFFFGGYLRKECGYSAAVGLKRTEKFFFLSLARARTWHPCLNTHEVTESIGKRRLPDPTSGMMLFNDLTPLNPFFQLPRSTMEFFLHSSALSTSTFGPAHAPVGDGASVPKVRKAAWEAQKAVCGGLSPASFHYLKCAARYELCFNVNIFLCKTYFIA